MKALSIQQPWAWAILHAGKRVENRTWGTHYRGPLLIHAGKAFDREGAEYVKRLVSVLPGVRQDDYPRGGIVGVANLTDILTRDDPPPEGQEPWFFGPFGWVLHDPVPLPLHPCKGALGLFEVDYEPEPQP